MVGHGPHGMPGEVSSSSVPTLDRKVQPRNKSIELKHDSSTIEGANSSSPQILTKIVGEKEETCIFLVQKQKSKYINLNNIKKCNFKYVCLKQLNAHFKSEHTNVNLRNDP